MAALTPVVVDFETYWSTTHTLSKMSPIVYCMHPDTEIISCATMVGDGETHCAFGESAVRRGFFNIDWSDKIAIAHNMSGFDAMLLAWRFGVKPAMWACTLSMARPHHAKTTGLSLAKLAEHYNLGVKNNAALLNTRGKRLADFTQAERDAMGVYNGDDVILCRKLFDILLKKTSKDEMRLIDATIRMLVEPKFVLDRDLLQQTLEAEQGRKRRMLVDLATKIGAYQPGMDDEDAARAVSETLGSAKKFGELLTALGVEVPTKVSPTTGKVAPALAKTDEGFLALVESDDPLVSLAANTRLGVKSTLLESRIGRFIEAADACGGKKPIALLYYGADTTGRWSGTFKMNDQNMPRVNPKEPKPTDALRYSLKAPPGFKVVVADLSGIELRVNLMLWQVPYAMELYASDPQADLYKPLAAEVFAIPVEEVTKPARQAGKAMHLGCGFGLGSPQKYVAAAKQMAQLVVTEEEAKVHIAGYRKKHPEVVAGWKKCHAALEDIYLGVKRAIDPWGLCHSTHVGIRTPKGAILYPDLRQEAGRDGKLEWTYGSGRNKTRIYAGKVTENIVQHLARQVIADNLLQVRKETGYYPSLCVHDELVYVVPEQEAEQHLDTVQRIMRTPPTWWPELVTWSEGDIADNYGAAK